METGRAVQGGAMGSTPPASASLSIAWSRRASAQAALPLAGLRVADIGCGAGLVSEPLARAGAEVLGIDASEKNVAIAARHAAESGLAVDYRCASARRSREKWHAIRCRDQPGGRGARRGSGGVYAHDRRPGAPRRPSYRRHAQSYAALVGTGHRRGGARARLVAARYA